MANTPLSTKKVERDLRLYVTQLPVKSESMPITVNRLNEHFT